MTAYALITGTLFRPPEQRTSKNGNPFVTATLKAKDGETAQWWKVLAFSESVQAELMRLRAGCSFFTRQVAGQISEQADLLKCFGR